MKISASLAAMCGACALAIAGSAAAECDSQQEAVVGKAIAEAASAYVPEDSGHKIVDLMTCEFGGSMFETQFRYSVEDGNKTTWLEGEADGKAGRVTRFKVRDTGSSLGVQSQARLND